MENGESVAEQQQRTAPAKREDADNRQGLPVRKQRPNYVGQCVPIICDSHTDGA